MEQLRRQGIDGIVELAEKGLHGIICQLDRPLELQVEEVTLVHGLEEIESIRYCANLTVAVVLTICFCMRRTFIIFLYN